MASFRDILPRPRRVRLRKGDCRLTPNTVIVLANPGDSGTLAAAKFLQKLARRRSGWAWVFDGRASSDTNDGPKTGAGIVIIERLARPIARFAAGDRRAEQWYSLRIREDGVRLSAVGALGLRYGVLTLGQLIAAGGPAIRAMDLEDWPDFAARGVMLDISRDKVPTIATLERLVDLLAGWKINQLQLYTEHTFAYAGHERVWRGASPLTARQSDRLDRYCRERGIELVPNQNSFGHMERWLKHAAYADLAETVGPWKTPWGEARTAATTLNPLDPRSLRLVASLYDQLLPHFASRLFNVGCDETWELGQGRSAAACRRKGVGRVYLDYLLKLHREVRRHGRRMMFWADIAQQHPELIAKLPKDVIPLVWGYEANHPFDAECARLARRGLDFYVCPGTSSWCSFTGRSRNCLANLRRAAESGVRHGAAGYLITDWGDFGHRQYLPASYLGFLYGAAVSWCGAANTGMDAPREVSRHAFNDPTGAVGQLWFEAGRVHELSGVSLKNRTLLFAIMGASFDATGTKGESVRQPEIMSLLKGRENGLRRIERQIDELEKHANSPWQKGTGTSRQAPFDRAKRARLGASPLLPRAAQRAKFAAGDGELVRQELLATLAVLRHACRRGLVMLGRQTGRDIRRECRELAADMRGIVKQHRRLWLARNRLGGLKSSLAYYRRSLREYLAISQKEDHAYSRKATTGRLVNGCCTRR